MGQYPYMGMLDFSSFCDRYKITDKNVSISTIDRIFITTNVEAKDKMEDNPERALCRFEFYEILVRLGSAKFRDTGVCSTFSDSLKKLLNENIFPNANTSSQIEFREKELWTLEVSDLFEANEEGLRKIFT